jgi:hypothetical protein
MVSEDEMFFFGDNYFGQVDRVPGLFHVKTRFLHIWFVPLVPRESYLFFDGVPDDTLVGIRIRFHWRSVLMAWLRGFLIFCAVDFLLMSMILLEADQMGTTDRLKIMGALMGMSLGACAVYWCTLRFSRANLERAISLGALLHIPRRVVEAYMRGAGATFWDAMWDRDAIFPHADQAESIEIRAALAQKNAEGAVISAIKDAGKKPAKE